MHRVPRPLSITHGWWVYTLFIGVHLEGVSQALKDGLLHGCGDAVIGIDPATDSPAQTRSLLELLSAVIERYEIPMQSCVLAHVTTTLRVMEEGAPVDLILQSVAGIEGGNRGFGLTLDRLAKARAGAFELGCGIGGRNVTYFETGQGSALSADAHRGVDGLPVDQQMLEVPGVPARSPPSSRPAAGDEQAQGHETGDQSDHGTRTAGGSSPLEV